MSTLYLLDMTTGKLQTELSPQQPNYPGIAQGQRQTSWLSLSSSSSSRDKAIDIPEVHPLPGTHYLIYIPLKWASNRSVYLLGTLRGSGTPPHQLALLRDISKDGTHQQNNLQPISAAAEYNECAMTPDNRFSRCLFLAHVFLRTFPQRTCAWRSISTCEALGTLSVSPALSCAKTQRPVLRNQEHFLYLFLPWEQTGHRKKT